jgi:hypothetical protein
MKAVGFKCFAYLPCNRTDFDNIWKKSDDRRRGQCQNGLKVLEFKSLDDYNNYMNDNLIKERNQGQFIHEILLNYSDYFLADYKRNEPCIKLFPDYYSKIAENFAKKFLI